MPAFLLWPKSASRDRPPRRLASIALTAAALVFVCGAIASGAAAFVRDLRTAFRWAGPSVFTPLDRAEMDAVRRAVPPGSTILVTVGRNGAWTSLLWQRALYPERTVVLRGEPVSAGTVEDARRRWRIDAAVSIGDPPPDPGFSHHRDLGAIPGLPGRVWLAELAP